MKWTKAKAHQHHARRRAKERYGVGDDATVRDLTRILRRANRLKHRDLSFQRPQHRDKIQERAADRSCCWEVGVGNRQTWRVTLDDGREFRVVWDGGARRIVTFLPLEHRGGRLHAAEARVHRNAEV